MSKPKPNGAIRSDSPSFQKVQSKSSEEPCISHKDKSLQLYCATCEELVCANCIVESHSQHKFRGIQEVANEGRQRVQELLKYVGDKHSADVHAQMKKIESMKRDCIVQTDKVIEQFKERQAYLCQEVEIATLKHISAIQVRRQKAKQEILVIEKEVSEKRSTGETLRNMCSYLMQDGSDVAVIRARGKIDLMAKTLEKAVDVKEIKPPKIIFLNVEESAFENLFGNFEIAGPDDQQAQTDEQENKKDKFVKRQDSTIELSDIVVEKIHSFECQGKGGVLAVQPLSGKSALVTCYDSANKIYVTDVKDDQAKYSLSLPINDLAVTKSGDIVISSYHSKCIKRIHTNGEVEQFISTSQLLPLGLHVSRNGDIYVCLVDQMNYVIEPNSKRQVVKFSKIGMPLDVFEFNGYRRLFTLPGSVSENSNEDICVVDLISENSGGLIILDKNGQQKYTYSGIGENCTFRPHTVCNDEHGHIIVSDLSNHFIHILNEKAKFMKILLTAAEGLYRPTAINIDDNGYLWVGHVKEHESDGEFTVEQPMVQVFKYII